MASVLALDYWIFAVHGLGRGLREILQDPVDLLVVAGLSAVAGLFHECGHASGCRCGGARTGVIGFGIYLVYPSFFTNVTDSYRLSRAGRLRTDLGGLYFNLIFMLVLAGIYAGTSDELLLLVIALTHLEMLEQLLPFARYDGYYILSDLVGVPDLFARVVPILRSVLHRGPADPRVSGLRRRSRVVVTSWVLIVVPLLTLSLGYLVLHLPADQPGPLALGVAAGPVGRHRGHGPPLRAGRRGRDRRRAGRLVDRRVALHRGRPGPAAGGRGPAAGRPAAWDAGPWSARPGWLRWPGSGRCGPRRARSPAGEG